MAVAASWVEMLGRPYSEIQKSFRNSELTLLGWRTRERSAYLEKKFKNREELIQSEMQKTKVTLTDIQQILESHENELHGAKLPEAPAKLNPEAPMENDVRNITGPQLLQRLAQTGMKVPPPMPSGIPEPQK
ncbi:MAG: hypothetical protein KGN01_06210 [Patescibacteria group bacterium]|nr:hypothetical protein [Patescibacteria group bacterium]